MTNYIKKWRKFLKEQEDQRGLLLFEESFQDGSTIKYFFTGGQSSYIISAYLNDEQKRIAYVNIMHRDKLSTSTGKKSFAVKWIEVSPSHQRKYIGTNLYILSIKKAKEFGAELFFSDSRRSTNSDPIWKKREKAELAKLIKTIDGNRYVVDLANWNEAAWSKKK